MSGFDISPQWRWQWEDMCGPGGLSLWSPEYHDLGICFQHLCLQIPVLALLAIISSYYSGRHFGFVLRGKLQIRFINLRAFVSICLAFTPIVHIYVEGVEMGLHVVPINLFLAATQCLTWFIHFIYLLALKKRLGLSPRGPVKICVLWTLYAVLSVINLHSNYLVIQKSGGDIAANLSFRYNIAMVVFLAVYAISLVPSEGSSERLYTDPRFLQNGEQEPLLGSNNHASYNRFVEEQDPYYLGVAMEGVNFFSRLLFYWVNPLIKMGTDKELMDPDDLYDLPVDLSCGPVSSKLQKALLGNIDKSIQQSISSMRSHQSMENFPEIAFSNVKRPKVSLLRAMHKCFWFQFYTIGVLRFISDCSGFAGPLLLNMLVNFIEDKNEDIGLGYLYAFGLFITTLIGALCNSHFNFYMSLVGLKIRASLVTTIYRKTLTVEGSVLNSEFNVGEIINFMSTDTDRIVNSCPSFHAVWSIPFQLGVTLYLLYNQVGLSFLAGVAFSVLLIPVNKFIAGKIGELSTKLMDKKDERVKLITEILRGIRTIKLHVWENHFIKLITKQRIAELKYLKGRKYLDAFCVYFWATTPVLISILTFGTYVLLGHKLTAATVFTSMALLNMLIAPLNAFPWVLNGLTEAWVSIKRVQRLLDLPDLDLEKYYDSTLLEENMDNYHVILKGVTSDWGDVKGDEVGENQDKKKIVKVHQEGEGMSGEQESNPEGITRFSLKNINLYIKHGEFICVMGQVGSGKSSLLGVIIAELSKKQGSIAVGCLEQGFGFVTQQPWLQRGTLRDNILFGKAYDDTQYKKVLFACGLSEDIHLLPMGDLTRVGEGGVTLSGGQKARVALARAVYQDYSIYVMDDIMSAVDRNVAKHIFQHCILGMLITKTRILCTHHTQYVAQCDRIVVIKDGEIVKLGRPSEVFAVEDFEELSLPIDSDSTEFDRSVDMLNAKELQVRSNELSDNNSMQNEEREVGTVQFDVYGSYWKAIGHLLSMSILIAIVLMQISRNMTDWWLSYWVTNISPNSTNTTQHNVSGALVLFMPNEDFSANVGFYMTVYGILVGLNTLFTLFRAFLFAYGGVRAATKIHRTLLKVIMKAKVTFFDIVPLGRLLNRFSSDTYTIDDSLPFILNILLAQIFGVIGSVVVAIYGLPWLCLILLPLMPIYHWLQFNYRVTSRELKRLSSVTLSPIYSHFNETLQGLPTIRAFRATQRFKSDNEDYIEDNLKVQFASAAASQWLAIRLQLIGVAMVTGVGMIAVIQHQFDVADPGLVGLAISYALSITSLLSGVVNAFTETEREMIAVERVNQYIEVAPEAEPTCAEPLHYGWPSHGVVSFDDVVMKYRSHLAPSLNGVTFETMPGEKIGVVGRTGAGKSSLLYALFQLVKLHSGRIIIDGINIEHIARDSLRSRLSVIPQDPFLFSGTVRENVDPLGEHRDPEIWSALTRVNLTATVRQSGGLETKLGSGGITFSTGQKQLLCLARAILRNAKIICIDEATANVDQETDRQIQQILRSAFCKSTMITIAHRVQTVMDYDRVLVMGHGEVLEFESPTVLLEDPESHFYRLVNPNM